MDVQDVDSIICENAEKTYNDMVIRNYGISTCKEDMTESEYRENILTIDLARSGYTCDTINNPC